MKPLGVSRVVAVDEFDALPKAGTNDPSNLVALFHRFHNAATAELKLAERHPNA